jgi:hypothetical protein
MESTWFELTGCGRPYFGMAGAYHCAVPACASFRAATARSPVATTLHEAPLVLADGRELAIADGAALA